MLKLPYEPYIVALYHARKFKFCSSVNLNIKLMSV